MEEVWKDIKGYEGLYQISNLGRVKSLIRETKNQYGKEEKILKIDKDKYYYKVGLFKGKKQKHHTIHRLLAEAFIPNPNNYPCVNHKDEDKLNNSLDNLEWCTFSYNNNYGNRTLKSSISKQKAVIQYDLDGNFIKEWSSEKEATTVLKLPNHIVDVCSGRRKKCGGYRWKFKEVIE